LPLESSSEVQPLGVKPVLLTFRPAENDRSRRYRRVYTNNVRSFEANAEIDAHFQALDLISRPGATATQGGGQ